MLYIKFEIQDSAKYEDFQKLYNHMVKVRQPGFKFDDEGPEFDWDNMPEEEVDAAVGELNKFLDEQVEPEIYRCKDIMPSYVNVFLERYLIEDNENLESLGNQTVLSIFNYLEFGFEVDMDNLKKINERVGIVEFSTGNYPFGGMERFIMTLAAYDLKPVACYDGFKKCEFNWTSNFDYDLIILPKKQNRFQMIKNFISNSFIKKFMFSMIVLISSNAVAQMDTSTYVLNNSLEKKNMDSLLVLEKPEFPSPEKELLFFFSETYFFDLHNYSGNVQKVNNVRLVYHPDERIISSDTSSFGYENHAFKDRRISRKPIIDHIGIDSISKRGRKFQLFHFDEYADYMYQVYELKNKKIIGAAANTSVQYYHTDYTYNKNNKLSKAVTTDDYGIHEFEVALYNYNNAIIFKRKFESNDGITVTTTNYSYKSNLLTQVEMYRILYLIPLDEEQKPIEKINYSNYTDDDTFVNLNISNFTYNDQNELIKIVKTNKGFSENDGVSYEDTKTFTLDHGANKLIINASLPEKRTYEYIFDKLGNPKEINSYVVEKDTTWLHKKTTFKILYNE